ncbi:hypothetical protein QM012_006662 [Aureobasidium pullulans]|uniref:F-box domain-containing protein n=1 Tax=Aureobasidium pullulans TaxID=5580 RepID=A0ABR0TPH9_AURPU
MPLTIKDIPNEVLKHILVQVREQGGYDALRMALLVSHLWNDAGTPVLYEHVVLHNDNIVSFLKSASEQYVDLWALTAPFHELICYGHRHCLREASSTFEEAKNMFAKPLPSVEELTSRRGKKYIRNRERTWKKVHSLTLNVKPEGSGNTRNEERNRQSGKLTPIDMQLMRLASMLQVQFPVLDTFSLFTNEVYRKDQYDMERNSPGFFDARVFLELVKSLPESCTSIMLDTNGREIQFGTTSPRMCLKLRENMPRLRHLSLRVSYVCESMLIASQQEDEESEYVHAPHLRSLSVSFVPRNVPYWFDMMYARNVCKRVHFDGTAQLPNDHALGSNDESGTIRLARSFQQAYSQGRFPHAKSIQIISPMRIHRREDWKWSAREHDEMMIVRDCIQDKTHALRFVPSKREYIHDEDRAIIDRHDVFAMGNHEDIKLFAEDGRWHATANYRARLPVDSPEAQFEKCSLKTLNKKELGYFIESLARETHEKLSELHKDLTEEERHPGRIFHFEGAAFAFRDFMPENL